MRVPKHVVESRRTQLAALIDQHHYMPVNELCKMLGISPATARRDLVALAKSKKLKRTHGGAVSEFNERFPSFRERCASGANAKLMMAREALSLMRPGGTYFFDSGSTIFAIAEEFLRNPITPVSIVTSNIPVGEVLSDQPGVHLFQVAGQLLSRQSVILGEAACRSMEFWDFDVAFFSAQAITAEGIWNSQEIIVRQQSSAMARAKNSVFCIDATKVGEEVPFFLCGWDQVGALITDATAQSLEEAGVPPLEDRLVCCKNPRK